MRGVTFDIQRGLLPFPSSRHPTSLPLPLPLPLPPNTPILQIILYLTGLSPFFPPYYSIHPSIHHLSIPAHPYSAIMPCHAMPSPSQTRLYFSSSHTPPCPNPLRRPVLDQQNCPLSLAIPVPTELPSYQTAAPT